VISFVLEFYFAIAVIVYYTNNAHTNHTSIPARKQWGQIKVIRPVQNWLQSVILKKLPLAFI